MACECNRRAIGEHKDVEDTLRGMDAGVDMCSDEIFLHVYDIYVYVYM